MATKRASSVIYRATLDSIRAAKHLTDEHKGAIAALKYLAKKIDSDSDSMIREHAIERMRRDPDAKAPPLDNVSLPTYLKYCEALGLTPSVGVVPSKGASEDAGDDLDDWNRKQAERRKKRGA